MAILYFSDVLKKVGIDPAKVKLIRHSVASAQFKPCYENKMVWEYTRVQNQTFSKGYDYWAVFISAQSTLARFYALYHVDGCVPATPDLMPPGFPHKDWFEGTLGYFNLEPVNLLRDYENRMLIEWGRGTLAWHQKGTTEKPIVAIQADEKKVFAGFENLVLSFDELEEIIKDEISYEAWHTALRSVYGVYLIVDVESGLQYVGSACGENGLLGRWKEYVFTKDGGNKKMRELLQVEPERYHNFQFSVLEILPKSKSPAEVLRMETLYKEKLLTREFGLNDN
ncbi:GIY-YIG nuclease family protein [Ihubacter sp. rT4E-8]|uniref:GIY-YIG nuclease family protein n=1 Tax=Ihubacter sp. rT4E-8 TaxID=3242369 RepID=UPI003CEDD290